jgi:type II secretory pathway pseudopilin PulG
MKSTCRDIFAVQSFSRPVARRRGFSTLEVLVVAGVLVLLLAVAARAVSGVVYSSQRSLAENQLRAALAAARDAAIASRESDVAAVFFFRDGRIQVQPCIGVGKINDIPMTWEGAQSPDAPARDIEVFVPVDGARALQMPRGWTVRGYAPAGSLHREGPPGSTPTPNENGWYDWIDPADQAAGGTLLDRGVWVFPETDFLPTDAQGVADTAGDEGWRRQTFMIRFAAQSGEAMLGDTRLVLVVDPLDADYRFTDPFQSDDVLQGESIGQRVRKILQDPILTPAVKRELLGDRSSDTVLSRAIAEFALTDERRLANAIGARSLNRDTQSLYRVVPEGANGTDSVPMDGAILSGSVANAMRQISDYIGRRAGQGAGELDEGTVFEAKVFTMSRYLGQVQEIVDR